MASEIEKLNRALRRKRRKRIVRFILVSLAVVVLFSVLTNIFLRVESVALTNSTVYSSAELLSACDALRGKPLLPLNCETEEKRLETDYPFIKTASLSVSFPDKLKVTVTPAVPAYSIAVKTGYICLDEDLKILGERSAPSLGTLVINGMSIDEYTVGKTLDSEKNIEASLIGIILTSLREKQLDTRVTLLDFTKKYNIFFVLDGIITVEIGNSENIDKKTALLVEILGRNPQDKPAVINVSDYTEGRYRADN